MAGKIITVVKVDKKRTEPLPTLSRAKRNSKPDGRTKAERRKTGTGKQS